MIRRAWPIVLLLWLASNTAVAERPGRRCLGCIGPADPEAQAIGVAGGADVVPLRMLAQVKKRPERKAAAGAPRQEPGTRIHILNGGEYWNVPQEVTFDVFDTLRQVRPDVLHASILGPEVLSGIHTDKKIIGVTPMSPPGPLTLREYLAWWKKFNAEAHKLGIKVQATFSLSIVFDNPGRNMGWFKYYNELWEEDVLGPKPVRNPVELMQRDAAGNPLLGGVMRNEHSNAYHGCPNNPHWRQLMKQFVKVGIEAGFDGFMVQFHYRYDCLCGYCQRAFRDFLAANYTPAALRDRLGIVNVESALLDTTRGRPGLAPQGEEADSRVGPLGMAARQFTNESTRNALQEVFLDYGRKLKPDLLVSSWMHHRSFLVPGVDYRAVGFNSFDERGLLAPEQWAQGEDYVWYCLGQITSRLAEHNAGDATLTAKFIHNLGRGKPFVMAKYDYARPRLSVAELWTHGGIALALNRFKDVLAPYYAFAHRYRDLYQPAEPYAEMAVLMPRRGFYDDDASFLPVFDRFGHALLESHILFDVVIDQRLAQTDLARYRAVMLPTAAYLSPNERQQLEAYRKAGGTILIAGRKRDAGEKAPALPERLVLTPPTADPADLGDFVRKTVTGPLSGCDAPWTAQMTVWRQPDARRLLVHLVNYDRDERTAGEENARAAGPVEVRLNLPQGARISGIHFATPEHPDLQALTFDVANGQVRFRTPGFLVYAVATVEY